MEVTIDFSSIRNMEDFYSQLQEKLKFPPYFGKNLDALSDSISGDLEMPLHLHLINMELSQLEKFEPLMDTLDAAEKEVPGFFATYSLVRYPDEEE